MRQIIDYTYYQAENTIEDTGGIPRLGLDPAVKHIKRGTGQGRNKYLPWGYSQPRMAIKTLHKTTKSRPQAYKAERNNSTRKIKSVGTQVYLICI